MRSITSGLTFTCATCETSAGPSPTFHLGLAFCCTGCAADGPCTCSYDFEDDDDRDAALRHHDTAADDARRLVGAAG